MPITLGSLSSGLVIPVRLTHIPSIGLDGGGGSTLTFTNVPVGDAYSDRLVVAMFGVGTGSNVKATSLLNGTIGGITANIGYYDYGQSSGMNGTGMLYAMVPSGTTATVFVNLGADPGDGQGQTCACYSIDAKTLRSTTPIFTGTNKTSGVNVTSLSVSNVPFNPGGLVLASSAKDGNADNVTFTNVDKDAYEAFEDNDRAFHTGSALHVGLTGTKTVSVNYASALSRTAFGVSAWR